MEQVPKHKRGDNSHATPTPLADSDHVYAVFSAGGIVAFDHDGNKQWVNDEVSFYSQHGLGSSPVLYEDTLIMPFDGSSTGDDKQVGFKKPWDGAVLLAVDKNTGETRWRGSRGMSRLGHVTPQILEQEDSAQLISAAGDVIQGHDPKTGDLIWTVYSQGEGVAPSVVLGDGVVYSCSGFEATTLRVVRYDGEGDVTDSHIAWEQIRGVPSLASPLLVDELIYTATDKGIVSCFNALTGEEVWKQRVGGKFAASPILADGHIYLISEHDGETTVIEPGTEYKEVARNPLDEEFCKASIAVSGGNLFIRSEQNLICVGESPR